MKNELPRVINYNAEMTRTRFWQEAALAAMVAEVAKRDYIDAENARAIAGDAFLIADEMYKQHGPSVSGHLQTEVPFVAAAGVRDEETEDESAD